MESSATSNNSNNKASKNAFIDVTADWQTYTDATYNFSFKYPEGLKAQPSGNDIFISKSEDFNTDGSIIADVSIVSITIRDSSSLTGSQVGLDSNSGKIIATYDAGIAPMRYTCYVYEFQKNGKYYIFRLNNYNNKAELVTPGQFKKLIETIAFKQKTKVLQLCS